MATYPKLDLPTLPFDLELRLQSEDVLDHMHTVSENNSFFYGVAHKAVTLATKNSIDTPQLQYAAETGARVYEALGYFISPNNIYTSEPEKVMTIVSARQFLDNVKSTDDYLTICDYARARMEADAPHLTEVITEVSSRYVKHDKVAVLFAVQAAAAMRGMQIFVDKGTEGLPTAS